MSFGSRVRHNTSSIYMHVCMCGYGNWYGYGYRYRYGYGYGYIGIHSIVEGSGRHLCVLCMQKVVCAFIFVFSVQKGNPAYLLLTKDTTFSSLSTDISMIRLHAYLCVRARVRKHRMTYELLCIIFLFESNVWLMNFYALVRKERMPYEVPCILFLLDLVQRYLHIPSSFLP